MRSHSTCDYLLTVVLWSSSYIETPKEMPAHGISFVSFAQPMIKRRPPRGAELNL